MDILKTFQIQMNYYGNLNGVYGIKTGFTNGANRCLVTACKRNDLDIICVVLGADTKNFRTKDSINLIEYTFKHFKQININDLIAEEFNNWKNTNLNNIIINKGIYDSLNITYKSLKNNTIPIKNDLINSLKIEIDCPFTFEAPLKDSSKLGCINIYLENELLDSVNIILKGNINKKNITYYITYFLKNFCNIVKNIL